jgi:hypothetical protein
VVAYSNSMPSTFYERKRLNFVQNFFILYYTTLSQNCLKTRSREVVLLNVLLVAGIGLVAILSALLVLYDDQSVGRKTCARFVILSSISQVAKFKFQRSQESNSILQNFFKSVKWIFYSVFLY